MGAGGGMVSERASGGRPCRGILPGADGLLPAAGADDAGDEDLSALPFGAVRRSRPGPFVEDGRNLSKSDKKSLVFLPYFLQEACFFYASSNNLYKLSVLSNRISKKMYYISPPSVSLL